MEDSRARHDELRRHGSDRGKTFRLGIPRRCVIGARLEVVLHGNRKHIPLNGVELERAVRIVNLAMNRMAVLS